MLQNSNKETVLKEEQDENTIAIYLEDEPINYIPTKDSGYTLDIEKSSCTNGVSVTFDYNTWSVKTNYSNYTYQNNERVKCSLYFKKRTFAEAVVDCGAINKDAGTCIKENYDLTDEVVDDETSDNNLRFIGVDPENYVWFNDELWRIIGVMNNIDDGTGTLESRLKIIRDESIGGYSWDYHNDETHYNNWTTATLKDLLNSGAYYNRTTGSYINYGVTETSVDFTTTGLKEEAKLMIENAIWNLGGSSTFNDVTTNTFYSRERGTETYQNSRATEWIGQIGLMYPSDYGYATSGGSNIDRNTCLSYSLYDWNNYSDCYSNDWLYTGIIQWNLTPGASAFGVVFGILSSGAVDNGSAFRTNDVNPTLYLSSNVKITGGDGSSSNPFNLTII